MRSLRGGGSKASASRSSWGRLRQLGLAASAQPCEDQPAQRADHSSQDLLGHPLLLGQPLEDRVHHVAAASHRVVDPADRLGTRRVGLDDAEAGGIGLRDDKREEELQTLLGTLEQLGIRRDGVFGRGERQSQQLVERREIALLLIGEVVVEGGAGNAGDGDQLRDGRLSVTSCRDDGHRCRVETFALVLLDLGSGRTRAWSEPAVLEGVRLSPRRDRH